MNCITIWAPRYSTDSCLVACYKITDGVNQIKFTKAKHLKDKVFEIEGNVARKCPTQSNGRIDVYVIPMSLLKCVEG